MWRRLPFIFLLSLSLLVGCVGDRGGIEVELITPGTWSIGGSPDHVLIWAHNSGKKAVDVSWDVTMADGEPLPAEWSLVLSRYRSTLEPDGSATQLDQGFDYPDTKWILATLNVPNGTQPGSHEIRIHAGPESKKATLVISANRSQISQPGDSVKVSYKGTFQHNGTVFDQGSFDTELGSGKTVTGFDYGLIGLALHEKVQLVLPPPLGYGYDQTGRLEKFSGRTLLFDVELLSL